MNALQKRIFLGIGQILFGLLLLYVLSMMCSCTKAQDIQPLKADLSTSKLDSTYKLSIDVQNHVHYDSIRVQTVQGLLGDKDQQIGYHLVFEKDNLLIGIGVLFDGTIASKPTGLLNDTSFIIINNKMNMCGGSQGLLVSYCLFK